VTGYTFTTRPLYITVNSQ